MSDTHVTPKSSSLPKSFESIYPRTSSILSAASITLCRFTAAVSSALLTSSVVHPLFLPLSTALMISAQTTSFLSSVFLYCLLPAFAFVAELVGLFSSRRARLASRPPASPALDAAPSASKSRSPNHLSASYSLSLSLSCSVSRSLPSLSVCHTSSNKICSYSFSHPRTSYVTWCISDLGFSSPDQRLLTTVPQNHVFSSDHQTLSLSPSATSLVSPFSCASPPPPSSPSETPSSSDSQSTADRLLFRFFLELLPGAAAPLSLFLPLFLPPLLTLFLSLPASSTTTALGASEASPFCPSDPIMPANVSLCLFLASLLCFALSFLSAMAFATFDVPFLLHDSMARSILLTTQTRRSKSTPFPHPCHFRINHLCTAMTRQAFQFHSASYLEPSSRANRVAFVFTKSHSPHRFLTCTCGTPPQAARADTQPSAPLLPCPLPYPASPQTPTLGRPDSPHAFVGGSSGSCSAT